MHDDPMWPTLSLDDAALTPADLDRLYPPGSRYPDSRDLLQTRYWYDRHGTAHRVDLLDRTDLQSLVLMLRSDAVVLHTQAASDEQQTLSSALSWAYSTLSIDKTAHLHPLVWLDSTPLMRDVTARLSAERADE